MPTYVVQMISENRFINHKKIPSRYPVQDSLSCRWSVFV